MQTSDTLGKFADALAKAQGTMKAATKDATNPHFGNKYADLTAIMAACRAGLSAHGIAINQFVGAVDAVVTVTTRLTHTSGEWVSSSLTVRARDVSPQSIGSACSYARRYSLAALVGVVADDDDDAETAQGRPDAPKPTGKESRDRANRAAVAPTSTPTPEGQGRTIPSPSPGPGPEVRAARGARVISEAQVKRLWTLARKQNWADADIKALILRFGFESSKDITGEKYDEIVAALETGELPAGRQPGEDDDGGFGLAPWEETH